MPHILGAKFETQNSRLPAKTEAQKKIEIQLLFEIMRLDTFAKT